MNRHLQVHVYVAVFFFIFTQLLFIRFHVVQDHLAWLTYHLNEEDGELLEEEEEEEEEDHGTAPQ